MAPEAGVSGMTTRRVWSFNLCDLFDAAGRQSSESASPDVKNRDWLAAL